MGKEKITINWNGKDLEVEEGSNLLKAALDNGIKVAHYCYHLGLPVAGVCRMCMVEQEGVPRPFPSCNANVAPGIKVRNDSEKVKNMVEWALQLHLVNHPLDCPICDQAGECGLQEYYLNYGLYDSSMIDQKVHKPKVQDIGRNVMLDAERCILCSRCVRFTDHITQSFEMGIVNRGDHATIVAHDELHNDYAMNLVDICPVGALTSKDFRFKQRVWFLHEEITTCIGCETGCKVKISYNESGAYRVKPVFDSEVNGYWMCDDGRDIYKHLSRADRVFSPMKKSQGLFLPTDEKTVFETVKGKKAKFILSAGLFNEEYEQFFERFRANKEQVALYTLPNMGEDFDGILIRGNKNANLKGAEAYFLKAGHDPSVEQFNRLLSSLSDKDVVFVVVPEILYNQDHFETLVKKLSKAKYKIALTTNDSMMILQEFDFLLPLKAFAEKAGTIVNFNSQERHMNAGKIFVPEAKELAHYVEALL